MIVREATLEDLPAIARVHVDTWRTTYVGIVPERVLANLSYARREETWKKTLSASAEIQQFTYVAENEARQIVGFANGGLERTGDPDYKGELCGIYINASYQRQGLGRKLVRAVAQRLYLLGIDSMLVWVLAENPACRFYEALGGQKVYERQINRGGVPLQEFAYGWTDTECLRIRS